MSAPLCACGCGKRTLLAKKPSDQARFIKGHHSRLQKRNTEVVFCACGCGGTVKRTKPSQQGRFMPNHFQRARKCRVTTGICCICGCQFAMSGQKRDIRKTCRSLACVRTAKQLTYAARPRTEVNKICVECGKAFTAWPCNQNKARFCSRACLGRAKSKVDDVTISYIKAHMNLGVAFILLEKYFKVPRAILNNIARGIRGKHVEPAKNPPPIRFTSKPLIRLAGDRLKSKITEVMRHGPPTQRD